MLSHLQPTMLQVGAFWHCIPLACRSTWQGHNLMENQSLRITSRFLLGSYYYAHLLFFVAWLSLSSSYSWIS